MICVSIGFKNIGEIERLLETADFAEVRFDLCDIPFDSIGRIFARGSRIIATYRNIDGDSDEKRKDYLKKCIELGAEYIDLSPNTDYRFAAELITYAKTKGCGVIISHHENKRMMDRAEVISMIESYNRFNPDIIKIVFSMEKESDPELIKSVYEYFNKSGYDSKLICFGTGKPAKYTRIESLKQGAPFMYAYTDDSKETAAGQYSYSEAKNLLDNNIKGKL